MSLLDFAFSQCNGEEMGDVNVGDDAGVDVDVDDVADHVSTTLVSNPTEPITSGRHSASALGSLSSALLRSQY